MGAAALQPSYATRRGRRYTTLVPSSGDPSRTSVAPLRWRPGTRRDLFRRGDLDYLYTVFYSVYFSLCVLFFFIFFFDGM